MLAVCNRVYLMKFPGWSFAGPGLVPGSVPRFVLDWSPDWSPDWSRLVPDPSRLVVGLVLGLVPGLVLWWSPDWSRLVPVLSQDWSLG